MDNLVRVWGGRWVFEKLPLPEIGFFFLIACLLLAFSRFQKRPRYLVFFFKLWLPRRPLPLFLWPDSLLMVVGATRLHFSAPQS